MFKSTVAQLIETAAQAKSGALKPVPAGNARESLLVQAVQLMAQDFGVTLKPIYSIDSRGELLIAAEHPSDSQGCGPLKGFTAWLNQARPRTGIASAGCNLMSESGWCYLNHFEAERMVLAYFNSLV